MISTEKAQIISYWGLIVKIFKGKIETKICKEEFLVQHLDRINSGLGYLYLSVKFSRANLFYLIILVSYIP